MLISEHKLALSVATSLHYQCRRKLKMPISKNFENRETALSFCNEVSIYICVENVRRPGREGSLIAGHNSRPGCWCNRVSLFLLSVCLSVLCRRVPVLCFMLSSGLPARPPPIPRGEHAHILVTVSQHKGLLIQLSLSGPK